MKRINFFILFLIFIAISFVFYQCELADSHELKNARESFESAQDLSKVDLKEYLQSIGFNPVEVNDQNSLEIGSHGCYEPGPFCYRVDTTDTIFIQGYCDDSVKAVVDYTVYFCPYDMALIIHRAFPIDCDSLLEVWVNLPDDQLDNELDKFWYKASLVIEEKLVRQYLPPYYKCPNTTFSSSYYSINCYQWCIYVKGKPGDPIILVSFGKEFCGEKCCKRTIGYCWDSNGNLVSTVPVFNEIGSGDCIGSSVVCGKGGRLIGDCYRECGEP